MNYFIVHQNKTYNEEMTGGYLWAPQRTSQGRKIYHWSNMTKLKTGDIVFSTYKRDIVSVNIIKEVAKDAKRPAALDKVELWGEDGWLAKAEYNTLEFPVSVGDNIEKILELTPEKYSPYTKQGRGSQGYLFEISKELGEFILNLVNKQNSIKVL